MQHWRMIEDWRRSVMFWCETAAIGQHIFERVYCYAIGWTKWKLWSLVNNEKGGGSALVQTERERVKVVFFNIYNDNKI